MLRVRTFCARILAAFAVGTATLLLMKPEPTMHWAIPPGVIHVAPQDATAARLRRFGLRFELYAVN